MAGLLSGFQNPFKGGGLLSDPMVRLQMGAAMMGGQTLGDQIGGGLMAAGQAGMQRREKKDAADKLTKTLEYLRSADPELAQAVEAGVLDGETAYKMHIDKQKQQGPNYMEVGGQLFDPQTKEWIAPPQQGGGMPKKSLQPIYLDDGKGGITVGQLDDAGNLVPAQMQNGFKPLSPYDKSFQGAQGREMGEFSGSQQATAGKDVAQADMALDLLDQIEAHPSLDMGVGGTAMLSGIPGTGGYDFQNLVDQAKSGAFLQAVQEMRGLGALSNAEGSAATSAITRMNTSTSKEAFLKAVSDYREIVTAGRNRAAGRLPQRQLPQGNGGTTSSGLKWGLKQ